MESNTTNKKPIFKKWWFWIGIIVVLAIIGSQAKKKDATADSSSDSKTATATAPAEMPHAPMYTAYSMFRDYDANEVSADNKYKGKEFYIIGDVESIGKDVMGTPYITLKVDNPITSVQCMLEDGKEAATVRKGEHVKIFGKGGGKLGNVFVNDAKIMEHGASQETAPAPAPAPAPH